MKKILLSAAIAFALNVLFTIIVFISYYLRVYTGIKYRWADEPFYPSIWFVKTVFPQLQQTANRGLGLALLFLIVIYFINTLVYTLPIYLILRFFTRNRQPKPLPSDEPPPPPLF